MNLKPNQNLRKESVKYKSNKKYKYLLFSGLALCSLSLEAKLNNDKVKAESEKTQTATKLEKDPLTGFSNTKRNIAFNDNPLLQEDTGNTSFNNSLVTVNKDNFASHFVLNGSAKWSVTKDNRGILLLTDNVQDQAGNATLSTKISVNDEFHLTGKINLGNKSAGQKGADGIALAFHTGDSNQIGIGGGCLGLAGLPYGFGFKLDTFWNGENKYRGGGYEKDPDRFNRDDGNQSFGAFAYDEIREGVSTVITYDGDDAPAQKISEPDNNTFRDFQADYNGTTHVLTIKYDNNTWSKCIDSWIPKGTTSLSFVITGVTGGKCNKQEFEINEFKYTGYGVVNTNFVNTEDNNAPIASLPQSNAKIKTGISLTDANDKIKDIENAGTYYLTGASITKGETTSDFDPTKTELNAEEDPQTITYKFATVKTALQAKEDPVVIYAGDDFNPEVGFESAKDKDGSSLPFNKITVDSSDLNKDAPGEYFVKYSYTPKGYGNVDLKTVSTKAKVKVIDRKYVKLKYVDQSGNVIDPKYLAGIPAAMSSGQHSGAYGSQFTLNPSEELTLNNKSYYTFKEAKLGTSTIDLNTNKNLTFGDNDQEVTLVYEGAEIASTDQNALTVHYYLKGTTQKLKDDRKVGGRIGQEITLGKDADDQKAPTGYTMDAEQTDQKYTFKPENGGEVAFYYTADSQKNITVKFVNAKNNQELEETYVPEGHHTGDNLDLSDPDSTDSQSELKNHLPKGYHYAKGDELNGNTQPGNVKYTSSSQTVTVYVAGNKVAANDTNALTVHYYLKGSDASGKQPVKVKPDRKVGGQVGVETVIEKDADDQKAPAGYTMDAEQTDQKYTFKPEGPGEVAFYYTANTQSNITVKFVNAKNGNEVKSDNPEGKTDDELDLQANGKYIQGAMPEGYHYATSEELNGKTQPDNVKYTPTPQTVTVYVAGNKVDSDNNASSQITVHHYLENTTTPVPGMTDTKIGGLIGDEVTVDPTAEAHKAPAGYTQVANQTAVKWMLKPNEGTDVTFYYTANSQSNITVKFVNAKNGNEVKSDNPEGKTDDELNLQANGTYIQGAMPEGYHYATSEELNGKTQPGNVKYTPTAQTVTVYVAGNKVDSDNNASSQITVHHYLEGTTTTVPGMNDTKIGGFIGDEITVDPKDHQAPAGYTLAANQTAVKWMLKLNEGTEVTFYYTADPQKNITVKFVNAKNGNEVKSDNPEGKTGNELDLQANGTYIQGAMPEGYHYAKGDELNGKTQPGNVKYTSSAQTVTVYVAGDPVDSKNNALSQITVHHYLKDTTTTVPGMSDTKIGGFIGDEITVDPTAEAHKAPAGYSLEANQAAVKWTLKPNEGKEIIIYYTASEQANITVKYVDVATGEVIFEDKPQGHTGGILDLSENGAGLAKLPEGYHYAKSSELQSGQSQPTNPVYTTENQTKIVYVAGNIVANNAENAVTVHHYLENTTTTVPGMKDIHRGGRVGQTLTFQTTDPEQQAPQGYTLVTQEAQSWKLKAKEAGNLIFYYKAKDLSNVAIKFVNSQNGKEVKTDYPIKATGTTLNITDPNGEYLKAAIPAGYHYATSNELKTGQQQPNKDLTYTPQPQEATIYVTGEEITNAVTVHHYLQGTTTTVPGMEDIKKGGRVGDTLTFNPTDPEQKAPQGYTLVTKEAQTLTISAEGTKELAFYYTANELNNITVNFINTVNGKTIYTDVPKGKHIGDELDLTSDSDYLKGILGENGKLKNYNYDHAEANKLTYKPESQITQVYVTPKDGFDPVKVTIKFVNINNFSDITTAELKGHAGDTISIDGNKINVAGSDVPDIIPDGYTLVTNDNLLNQRGLKQPKDEIIPIESKSEPLVFYVEKSLSTITIQHKYRIGSSLLSVPRMTNVVQTYRDGEAITINTNLPVHRAPSGYRLSLSQNKNLNNGLITIPVSEIPLNGIVTIYYDRIR